jgi:hypothetical protein
MNVHLDAPKKLGQPAGMELRRGGAHGSDCSYECRRVLQAASFGARAASLRDSQSHP